MTRVLLTRPENKATLLAELLVSKGHHVISSPLVAIEKIDFTLPPLPTTASVMITSAQALAFMTAGDLIAYTQFPCYCIGTKTAEAARQKGFKNIRCGDDDGLALAALIREKADPTAPLLYLCRDDKESQAAQLLETSGFSLIYCSSYAARLLPLSSLAREALTQKKLDCALFFSPQAAAHFVTLLQEKALEDCCSSLIALGLSEAVAKPLRFLPWQSIKVAKRPTEASLVDCLEV